MNIHNTECDIYLVIPQIITATRLEFGWRIVGQNYVEHFKKFFYYFAYM